MHHVVAAQVRWRNVRGNTLPNDLGGVAELGFVSERPSSHAGKPVVATVGTMNSLVPASSEGMRSPLALAEFSRSGPDPTTGQKPRNPRKHWWR